MVSTDRNKRGKLIAVALFITFLVVASKLTQREEVISFGKVLLSGLSIGIVSYFGLLWALNFQVTLRSMVFVLAQSSFIVSILTIFLEIFVFRRVGRVYEVLILLIISIVMFFITYGSYLMANIFNIAHFKELPLVQVAKTTSLLLSLLSLYFITFAILEATLIWYVTILLLAFFYILIFVFHFRHLSIQRDVLWGKLSISVVFTLLYALLYIVTGGKPLVYALLPSVIGYSLVTVLTTENNSLERKFELYLLTILAIIIVFFIAI